MQTRQFDLFLKDREYGPHRASYGGHLSKGRRKIARPLDRRKPLHLVLKSSHAKGSLSFLSAKNKLNVEKIFRTRSAQFGVTVQGFENMGNHIHALVKFKRKDDFQNFLRTVSALIARAVTGARKGKPFGKRFWDALAFTRVVNGLKDLRGLAKYFVKNEVEREIGAYGRFVIEESERTKKKLKSGRYRIVPLG